MHRISFQFAARLLRKRSSNKAEKKTDKKAAKEAKTVSKLPLDEQLKAKREELLIAQQGLGSTLQNPHRIKAIKKEIARILTQINATKGDK